MIDCRQESNGEIIREKGIIVAEQKAELLYSFEAIDYLDDETKRLYGIWLNAAVALAERDGRPEVTLGDVKQVTPGVIKEFSGA